MKPLGIKSQTVVGQITERKPFTNKTGLVVGSIKIIDGKPYMVTAIVRVTHTTFDIYGMDPGKVLKLQEFKDFQERREDGQINVYIPGKRLFSKTISE